MKYFAIEEFACPCCGVANMEFDHLEMIDAVREEVGEPLIVNSGYRCPRRNALVGGSRGSAHLLGRATDLRCTDSHLRFKIVKAALEVGFRRIEWATATWVHLDTGTVATGHAQDVIFLP